MLRRLLRQRPYHTLACAVSALIVTAAFLAGYLMPTTGESYLAVFKAVIVASQVATLGFVLVYTSVAKWWANVIGRTIVLLDVSLFFALLPVTLTIFFHLSRLESQLGGAMDLAAFTAIPVIMLWRIYVWLRLRRVGKGL